MEAGLWRDGGLRHFGWAPGSGPHRHSGAMRKKLRDAVGVIVESEIASSFAVEVEAESNGSTGGREEPLSCPRSLRLRAPPPGGGRSHASASPASRSRNS